LGGGIPTARVTSSARFATFDCYGTLIDWNAGLRAALGSDELLERYHEVEPEVEREQPSLPYREVLQEVARRIGAPDPQELPRSLPRWAPFAEVRPALEEVRRRAWRLAILSNTDRDLLDASVRRIGVPFDISIVASEIRSYKPELGHWHAFEREAGRMPDVHVGASLFHDIAPARTLGLKAVWVNRLGEPAKPQPTLELPDLERLPQVLEELVPV
jgi:2-haloacid dehalogenase